ncbi:urea transporter [uncultured Roseibium sp.]|uniref:urea transporter n=1 Tax=uncultured Roseibium sp. TaxID=1936171 RepID=UPI003216C87F
MTPLVEMILPPAVSGKLPYWRLVLRGCSQLCFQTNELTGLLFLAAVLAASPLTAAYMLVAAILAPGGRMLLGQKQTLETGLPGINPCLIAISLPSFYHTGWNDFGMWGVLLCCVAAAIVLVRILVARLPFPITALPFLIIFWVLWALAPYLDVLQPIEFSATQVADFHPLTAVGRSLGEALFSPTVVSGSLFLLGLLVSNWRHAIIALLGAAIGTLVSYYYGGTGAANADTGLYGFNGVLAAVAVYVICGGRLPLSLLAALLATVLMPLFSLLGLQALSAPFVLTVWFLLALDWIDNHGFRARTEDENEPGSPLASPQRRGPVKEQAT